MAPQAARLDTPDGDIRGWVSLGLAHSIPLVGVDVPATLCPSTAYEELQGTGIVCEAATIRESSRRDSNRDAEDGLFYGLAVSRPVGRHGRFSGGGPEWVCNGLTCRSSNASLQYNDVEHGEARPRALIQMARGKIRSNGIMPAVQTEPSRWDFGNK